MDSTTRQARLEQTQWALRVAREDRAASAGLYGRLTEYGWLIAEIDLMSRMRDAWADVIRWTDTEDETPQDWYRAAALYDGRRA